MKLMDAIKKRKSVRSFSEKKPDWRKIIRAIDAARYAPSAGGYFVTKFILVSDEKIISELGEASQQDFVGTAKYIVVAVSDEKRAVNDYGERGSRYVAQQAGSAIQNFLLALTAEKIVTTWVGHFYDEQVKKSLGVPEDLKVEAIFPIGIEVTRKRVRKEGPWTGFQTKKLDSVIYFDKWGNRQMTPNKIMSREVV